MKRLLGACAAAGIAVSPAFAIAPLSNAFSRFHVRERELRLAATAEAQRPAYNISVPVDHFHNDSRYEPHSDESYPLRYWFDDSHYQPGGPVIVLSAGELDAVERIPFIEYGIAAILAEATGGLAVLLEHRYYGGSHPTPDVSLENLRFLSTDQALADTAYFAQHVEFKGLEHLDLTAPETPWIIYGGSYAGAFAAFARKLYPDAFWGAISSSGVPVAIVDYWEYLDAARLFAPGDCAPVTQRLTHVVDQILFGGDEAKVKQLKDVFGLGAFDNNIFGEILSRGIMNLQATNWDPEIDVYEFGHYCGVITSDAMLYRSTAHLQPTVEGFVKLAGYADRSDKLVPQMLNYIGYVKSFVQKDMRSAACKDVDLVECYTRNDALERTDLEAGWYRSWSYQVCTQWGYFITGSGVPKDELPLVSRAVDIEYASKRCPEGFNITTPPDVESINKLGGFNFSYPRLAFLDGAQDPWRAAGTHRIGLPDRESTTEEPFILVDYGVHHWEENGLANATTSQPDFPPAYILDVQQQEIDFVKAWVEEFKEHKRAKADDDFPGEL